MPKAITDGPMLVIGARGYLGRYVAEAALAAGVPTYLLRRPGSRSPASVEALQSVGAFVVEGNINDKESMEKLFREKKIDVVVSVVGGRNILDQLPLIEAIEAAGTVKRFLPSEFGNDVDRANPPEPGIRVYIEKRRVRRAAEAAGIPYTYICCNTIAGWPYLDKHRPSEATPPLDRLHIYGDGNVKAWFVAGCDIGRLTVKAAYDARALRKAVHFRPACNFLSMNELASLWESKIGRPLPRVTVTEHELLAAAAENRIPQSFVASFVHDVYINGCQSGFSIADEEKDVEVCGLYPDTPFTFKTMEECFDEFAITVSSGKQIDGMGRKKQESAVNSVSAVGAA